MIVAWLSGLARSRTSTVLGTVAGIAITVGFLVAIGAFMHGEHRHEGKKHGVDEDAV